MKKVIQCYDHGNICALNIVPSLMNFHILFAASYYTMNCEKS